MPRTASVVMRAALRRPSRLRELPIPRRPQDRVLGRVAQAADHPRGTRVGYKTLPDGDWNTLHVRSVPCWAASYSTAVSGNSRDSIAASGGEAGHQPQHEEHADSEGQRARVAHRRLHRVSARDTRWSLSCNARETGTLATAKGSRGRCRSVLEASQRPRRQRGSTDLR